MIIQPCPSIMGYYMHVDYYDVHNAKQVILTSVSVHCIKFHYIILSFCYETLFIAALYQQCNAMKKYNAYP